jgi:hypothetical protein
MIRRFDEVLALKVSKETFSNYDDTVRATYQTHTQAKDSHYNLESRLDQLHMTLREGILQQDKLARDLESKIQSKVDRTIIAKFSEYEDVRKAFGKFFDQEFLSQVLE